MPGTKIFGLIFFEDHINIKHYIYDILYQFIRELMEGEFDSGALTPPPNLYFDLYFIASYIEHQI